MTNTPAVNDNHPADAPAVPLRTELPEALRNALQTSGTQIAQVRTYYVPEYVATELETLCTLPTSRKGCEGESPVLVVQRYSEFPDAEDFTGYVGFFRAECATEYGDFVAFTHYMRSRDTGQLGPLAEFFRDAQVPFCIKVARMGTRHGFSVYRPIPVIFDAAHTVA